MSKEMKMADYFNLPVIAVELASGDKCILDAFKECISDGYYDDFEKAAAHAVNNHDRLVEENAALRDSVNKLKADNLMQAWSMEKHLVVMQVFCLLVHQGKQGEANQWIFNTLAGPGLIPENNNQDAQTFFDEAMADEPQTFTEALKLVVRADEQGGCNE